MEQTARAGATATGDKAVKIDPAVLANALSTVEAAMQNGLCEAIGLGGGMIPSGFPQNQGSPWSEQLSQPTTIFKNLRWYMVSNMRQVLCEAYVELGLVQAIVDLPVDDALRGGVTIKSAELDEEQIAELQVSLDRDNDLQIAGQAAKWNRLFGGAGILVLTDQDPETPLDLGSIGEDTPVEFRAVDMWELFWDKQNTEGYDPTIQQETFEFYNYYGEQVHKSRVMKLKGLEAPSFIRPRLRGWGFSVVEILVRSINQYLKATDLAFEVLDEFKVDVFKIKNLAMSLMSPLGEEQVKRRIRIANLQKNYQNALTMDSEDDWDHKQLSFAGLGDAMMQIRMQVASDMRMPLTKLFGISAAGFNSGEDDIEVYNAMVESQVRNKIKYDLLRMIEIKCQKLFGFVPKDLAIDFKSLRTMSSEQEETVKAQKFARLTQALQLKTISRKTFHEACNKEDLLGVKIESDEELEEIDADVAATDTGAEGEDTNDPGAGRADSKSPRAKDKGGAPKGQVKQPGKGDSKTPKLANWDESKHPRDDDGKFGGGGGGSGQKPTDVDRAAFKKKYPSHSGDTPHSTGHTRDEAVSTAKALRADGIHATISHMDGPRTGKKSRYFVMVPESKKNASRPCRNEDCDQYGKPHPNCKCYENGLSNAKPKIVAYMKPLPALTRVERLMRKLLNSAAFDRAAYAVDGGDEWIDARRGYFFDRDKASDKGLWDKARDAAIAAFGKERWQFQVWWYRKQGGTFI